jgi:threonine/homoserine/homoserine lactone efflux protein
MLLTSGLRFGFARTLAHLVGVILGFGLMVALVGLGLNVVFERFPVVLPVMRVLGSLYMLWLALKIALAKLAHATEGASRPIGFFGAAAFQWVNPKAWVMALSVLSTYSGLSGNYVQSVLLITLVCTLITIPCSGAWALFGSSMRQFLGDPRTARLFNFAMAALLVASIAPILFFE